MVFFQITHSYPTDVVSKVVIPENYTLENALATNSQLSHSILALRTNLAPVIRGYNKILCKVSHTHLI